MEYFRNVTKIFDNFQKIAKIYEKNVACQMSKENANFTQLDNIIRDIYQENVNLIIQQLLNVLVNKGISLKTMDNNVPKLNLKFGKKKKLLNELLSCEENGDANKNMERHKIAHNLFLIMTLFKKILLHNFNVIDNMNEMILSNSGYSVLHDLFLLAGLQNKLNDIFSAPLDSPETLKEMKSVHNSVSVI